MRVAAIMPCRGRAEQTVRNVRRLLATAGDVEWGLILVSDGDDSAPVLEGTSRLIMRERGGYWRALAYATMTTDAPLLVNLANDLLPGQHWLQRAYAAYTQTFGDGPGLVGFNDGHHETGHSCHFLIARSLLDRYGGWPAGVYDHNFGDTELCQRAIADGLYVKAPWATLFHDHVYFGGQDDAVYQEGRAQSDRDHRIFNWRKAHGWPPYSETPLS